MIHNFYHLCKRRDKNMNNKFDFYLPSLLYTDDLTLIQIILTIFNIPSCTFTINVKNTILSYVKQKQK